jgi:hypothetical protein
VATPSSSASGLDLVILPFAFDAVPDPTSAGAAYMLRSRVLDPLVSFGLLDLDGDPEALGELRHTRYRTRPELAEFFRFPELGARSVSAVYGATARPRSPKRTVDPTGGDQHELGLHS